MVEAYDLCIVGAGLIGSSAAKYASCEGQLKVLLIGIEEPADRLASPIHGAHYDEARAAAPFTGHQFWLQAFLDSEQRFDSIESQSGLKFFHNSGFLSAGPSSSAFISNALIKSRTAGVRSNILSKSDAREGYPYLQVESGSTVVEVRERAGWLNPRVLRQAQMRIAQDNGCRIVNDVVLSVKCINDGDRLNLKTASGSEFTADKVLLCTGSFTSFNQLLPPHLQPDVKLVTQSVIFAELNRQDLKELEDMPSMVIVESDESVYYKKSCYVLPPVKYPDGKWYLKLGHGSQFEEILTTHQEVYNWYTRKLPTNIQEGLKDILKANFPNLQPVRYLFDTCVTTNTSNRLPIIDMATSNIAVAIGGNGYAAKSCDQLGRLGVDVVVGREWPAEYNRDSHRFRANKAVSSRL